VESSLVLLALGGAVGAILVYRSFTKTKEASEKVMDEYGKLLAEARRRMLSEQDGEGASADGKPASSAGAGSEPPVY